MRRGRRYREDLPVPGASRATVCTLCALRARSNGTEISKLAPMPVSTSSGIPAPRTEVRSRSPSTSTYRMRGLLSSGGADTGDVLPRDERGLASELRSKYYALCRIGQAIDRCCCLKRSEE